MRIVVIDNGFVFVCKKYTEENDRVSLIEARCIRIWGTKNGLGQLATGPTSETVLDDMIPVISVHLNRVVFSFEVTGWDKVFK